MESRAIGSGTHSSPLAQSTAGRQGGRNSSGCAHHLASTGSSLIRAGRGDATELSWSGLALLRCPQPASVREGVHSAEADGSSPEANNLFLGDLGNSNHYKFDFRFFSFFTKPLTSCYLLYAIPWCDVNSRVGMSLARLLKHRAQRLHFTSLQVGLGACVFVRWAARAVVTRVYPSPLPFVRSTIVRTSLRVRLKIRNMRARRKHSLVVQ
jgi:hypothetical protein